MKNEKEIKDNSELNLNGKKIVFVLKIILKKKENIQFTFKKHLSNLNFMCCLIVILDF